jgi:hypothetical protein
MFEPIPVPSIIVPSLPPEFDAWWSRASSRDANQRFQSAKELADTLGGALHLPNIIAVAEAPPGFREQAFSDYGLSVTDGAVSRTLHFGLHSVWPGGPFGKLLGVGIAGVILIAAFVAFERAPNRTTQTVVASTPVMATASAPPVATAPPGPAHRFVEDLEPDTERPSQASEAARAPLVDRGAPKPGANSPGRPSAGDARSPPSKPDRVRDKGAKSKRVVDFGI